MHSATLLKYNSLVLSRLLRRPIGRESSRLSRRAMPQCATSLSAGGRPCHLDCLSCYPSHKRPSLSDIQELAGKGRLHTTYGGIVLLARNSTAPPPPDTPSSVGRAACLVNNEPVRIYAPLLMRPWIMQACHSTAKYVNPSPSQTKPYNASPPGTAVSYTHLTLPTICSV